LPRRRLGKRTLRLAAKAVDRQKAMRGADAAMWAIDLAPEAAAALATTAVDVLLHRYRRAVTSDDEETLAESWIDGLACVATAIRLAGRDSTV
jgi:hypothetical protein